MAKDGSSTLSRIFGILAGVFLIITGVLSLFTPLRSYGMVGWLIAIALVSDGVAKIMVWYDYRKIGISDTWALVGGILSALVGILLICSVNGRLATDVIIAYAIAMWIVFAGIVRIARSITMRDIQKNLGTMLGSNWGLALIVGIIMVVFGVFCMIYPGVVMVAIGWWIGFALIIGGAGLITATV
ncbi:MAG: DUF308 domain-containing protein [Coriobacteriales bacterium]|nr:DUF308 domain-containing protein [Coriobacteriales bacterium]